MTERDYSKLYFHDLYRLLLDGEQQAWCETHERLRRLHKLEGAERVRSTGARSFASRIAAVEADLAAFKASHALAGGEPAQVLTEAEQDAKSWEVIERWHKAQGGACGLVVEFSGPFGWHNNTFFYARVGCCHSKGNTRSDALAHAAEHCKAELEKASQ